MAVCLTRSPPAPQRRSDGDVPAPRPLQGTDASPCHTGVEAADGGAE